MEMFSSFFITSVTSDDSTAVKHENRPYEALIFLDKVSIQGWNVKKVENDSFVHFR